MRQVIRTFLLAVPALLALPVPALADPRTCISRSNEGAEARANHRSLAAREAYRACIAEPGCPEIVLSECSDALNDLKTAIPTLIVSIVDANQHDVESPSLTIDGVNTSLDGSTLEVDPGSHDLVARAGGRSSQLHIDAHEYELNRRVEIVLQSDATSASAPAPAAAVQQLTPDKRLPAHAYLPVYVLGGVGAVAAASFGYFSLAGHQEMSALDQCKPACNPDDVHRVQTKYHLADISLGVSVIALATGGYLLASHRHNSQTQTAGLTFDLTGTSGGGLLSFALRQ